MDEPTVKRAMPEISAPVIKPRKVYEADGKDRVLLFLAWGLGFFGASLLGSWGLPGLGITILTLAWYGVLFWYKGMAGLGEKSSFLLLVAVFLLALTFSLYSNPWLRTWNIVFLAVLITVQTFQWSGQGNYPWTSPMMLMERLWLLLGGLFGALPASYDTAKSYKGDRRVLTVLAGLAVAIPLLVIALLLLTQADQFFALVVENLSLTLVMLFGSSVVRMILGLLLAPFLFGLLYTLRHLKSRGVKSVELPKADTLLPCVVLALLDVLYTFFIAVQSAALFGGPAYLERVAGLTYAEYARSGFFQLVFVAVLNLTLVLVALQLARQEGGAWKALRVLATLLIIMSGVILGSAAYRMSLYVSVYGLSFKRFLTYWGMAMLGIFFAAALLKVWKKNFCYFKFLFAMAIAGWLVLNFCNVDRMVARYNVSLYQRNRTAVIDLEYLAYDLSYDTLDILGELPEQTITRAGKLLKEVIRERQQQAVWAATDWRTWSVSAASAAKK